jgi:hypothetical protein
MQKQKPVKYRLVRNPDTGLPEIEGREDEQKQSMNWSTFLWAIVVLIGVAIAAMIG